jgi:hypothetical protein
MRPWELIVLHHAPLLLYSSGQSLYGGSPRRSSHPCDPDIHCQGPIFEVPGVLTTEELVRRGPPGIIDLIIIDESRRNLLPPGTSQWDQSLEKTGGLEGGVGEQAGSTGPSTASTA